VNPAKGTSGSGVIVFRQDPFVYILTANHVVGQAAEVEVHTYSSGPMPRLARAYRAASVVARTDGIDDLALIRLMTRDPLPSPLRICPPRLLPRAKVVPVLTVGCDEGAAPSCTVDRAEKKPVRKPDGATGVLWEVTRKNAPGRSGGPLLDRRGYLLGVASG